MLYSQDNFQLSNEFLLYYTFLNLIHFGPSQMQIYFLNRLFLLKLRFLRLSVVFTRMKSKSFDFICHHRMIYFYLLETAGVFIVKCCIYYFLRKPPEVEL